MTSDRARCICDALTETLDSDVLALLLDYAKQAVLACVLDDNLYIYDPSTGGWSEPEALEDNGQHVLGVMNNQLVTLSSAPRGWWTFRFRNGLGQWSTRTLRQWCPVRRCMMMLPSGAPDTYRWVLLTTSESHLWEMCVVRWSPGRRPNLWKAEMVDDKNYTYMSAPELLVVAGDDLYVMDCRRLYVRNMAESLFDTDDTDTAAVQGTWEQVDVPCRFAAPAAVAISPTQLLMAGEQSSRNCWLFDKPSRTWTHHSTLKYGHRWQLAVADGCLWATSHAGSMQRYRADDREWEIMQPCSLVGKTARKRLQDLITVLHV